jgi:prevent-host-death family protein
MLYANIYEAKTNLSKLIAQVEAGDEVVLSRSGKPVARIIPWTEPAQAARKLGALAGRITEATDAWDFGQDDLSALMAAEPLFPEAP